jgi:transcriptional regulator with XRE-family HTH domain/tetratricopeptide (TPR) repeat protein
MTDTQGIETFYGAAVYLLRRWVRRLSREELAKQVGVSPASISNYEKGKTVPPPERRQEIARALGVSLSELDGLAAALRRDLAGLSGQGATGAGRLAAEIAADLAAEFHRASLPLVARLMAAKAAPLPAGEEEIRALAPVVAALGIRDLGTLVEKRPSLWTWAFVKLAGEESERVASVDAGRAVELAHLVFRVAERVPGEEGWVSRVFAWAFLANALRVEGDLKAAEEASAHSVRLQVEAPPGHPELPEPWRLLDLEASLRFTQRRLPEALRLLDRAEDLAPRSGPVRARLLCKRSNVFERLGDSESSIAALREALAEIDAETDPHLFCILQFNLADSLAGAGRFAEAEEMLPELRRLQAQLGNGLNQIRLRWLEAKIDSGLGRLDRAIETLSWVREAFGKEDVRYDEAQAGVELAGLYLQKGRTADAKRLVFRMAPVLKAKGVHVQAQKALALFHRAVEMETATPELAGRVADYLRRAQHDPELVFEAAA